MLWTVLGSAAFALAVCSAGKRLANWLGVMDVPDGSRKRHPHPTPLVGGIAVSVPVFATLLVAATTSHFAPVYTCVAGALAAFFALGVLDDRRHLRPAFRLTSSVALVLVAVLLVPAEQVASLRFSFLDHALSLGVVWSLVFTILCLVGLQNALNMADGRNGLASGMLLTWTLLLMAYAPPDLGIVLAALAAALVVTLGYNMAGRVFLGDSGTYGLSIAIGLLAVHVYSLEFPRLHADVVALWFLVPVVDALRLIVVRPLAGCSPFAPDENHLHNILERLLTWHWGLIVYLALVGVPALVALRIPEAAPGLATAVLAVYGALVLQSYWDRGARRLRLPGG